jgi:crotonobetainyl-CoA:carnitine CoA-transferase CaiB-like acyl-CoA transferase
MNMRPDAPAPDAPALLEGMRVVSFCHFLQGPAATQYLADMGADVIKVEPPRGAWERHWAGAGKVAVAGVSAFFLCGNRNKRSIAVDLKHPDAREVIHRLLADAHVLVENFRPGALERLGFGYEEVARRKPDIIYASASGYGSNGPYSTLPGQDLLIQAMSGLVASSARPGGQPTAVGCAAADQHGAALLALGIVGAYARLLATGAGTRVEANLLGAGIDLQMESLSTYFASGRDAAVNARDPHLATWFHEAPYGVFAVRDGFVAFSMNEIGTLAEALGSDTLAELASLDPYRERDRLAQTVAQVVQELDFATLQARLAPAGIWFARVDDFDDLRGNPQVRHNQVFREVAVDGEKTTVVNHPLRYDGGVPAFRGFPLRPGDDSRGVLTEAGFAPDEIDALVERGVVFEPAEEAVCQE